MTAFAFSKLIPRSNPTILLHDPTLGLDGRADSLAGISARIMPPLHLHAEQMGALYSAEADEWSASIPEWEIPRLEMMGGEFCVNAVRSSVLCLARQGRLQLREFPGVPGGAWGGWVKASGAEKPICVTAAQDAASLERTIAVLAADDVPPEPQIYGKRPLPDTSLLHCVAEVPCPLPAADACAPAQKGPCPVTLPGISHLLVDTERHPLPELSGDAWKKESEVWRVLGGLAGLPASGVVWYRREGEGYAIWPAVAVRAMGSEYLETACGSASMALALLHACGEERAWSRPMSIRQPSGETLTVTLTRSRTSSRASSDGASTQPGCVAWIAGLVTLAAEGKVYA